MTKIRQAQWHEALIFELTNPGTIAYSIPAIAEEIRKMLPKPMIYHEVFSVNHPP